MKRPEQSVFPESIDPLIYYQDACIENNLQLKPYYIYLKNNNFDGAKQYMAECDLDFYGAWLLNRIENCLYAVEDNIDEILEPKPELVVYSDTEPVNKWNEECFNWNSSLLVDPHLIINVESLSIENCYGQKYINAYGLPNDGYEDVNITIIPYTGGNINDIYNNLTIKSTNSMIAKAYLSPLSSVSNPIIRIQSRHPGMAVVRLVSKDANETEYYSKSFIINVYNKDIINLCIIGDLGHGINNSKIAPTGSTFDNTPFLLKGTTAQIICDLPSDNPLYDRPNYIKDKAVTYINSNPNILTVNDYGIVKAVNGGMVKIDAAPKSSYTGYEYTGDDPGIEWQNNLYWNIKVLELIGINVEVIGGTLVSPYVSKVLFDDLDTISLIISFIGACGSSNYRVFGYDYSTTEYFSDSLYFNGLSEPEISIGDPTVFGPMTGQYDNTIIILPIVHHYSTGITVKINDFEKYTEINFAQAASSVIVNTPTINLPNIGDSTDIDITAYDSTEHLISDPSFYYTDYDTSIIYVNSNGTIVALSNGSTSVHAYYNSYDYTTINVNVG